MNKLIILIISVIISIVFILHNKSSKSIEGFYNFSNLNNNSVWAHNPYTTEYKPAKTRNGAYCFYDTKLTHPYYRTNKHLAHMEHTRHPHLMKHKYEYDDTRCYLPQFRRYKSARLNELKMHLRNRWYAKIPSNKIGSQFLYYRPATHYVNSDEPPIYISNCTRKLKPNKQMRDSRMEVTGPINNTHGKIGSYDHFNLFQPHDPLDYKLPGKYADGIQIPSEDLVARMYNTY